MVKGTKVKIHAPFINLPVGEAGKKLPILMDRHFMNDLMDYIQEKKSRIPMGRFCKTSEIADMAAWVASPNCSFTTGQVFDLSGGRATY